MTATATKTANKKMTEAEYDLRRKHDDEQVEARQELVDAYRDQAYAKRFYDSGWTQQELADKEGKSQPWIVCRIRFGKFMDWLNVAIITTGNNRALAPKNLTERRFRSYWEQTSGNKDTARFRKVWKMIQEKLVERDTHQRSRKIITEKCNSDAFYTIAEVCKRSTYKDNGETKSLTETQAYQALTRMDNLGLCERRNTAQGPAYRIRRGEGRCHLDTAVLKHTIKEASALIRSIIKSATGDEARYSATGVALDAGKLKDLMNELKERITPGSA